MLKLSHFQGQGDYGVVAIPLFGKADAEFEKCASSGLLPDVVKYISNLRPDPNSQYVLVNAMGAGEWYGCFPAGTLVETSTGEKPIEEVEPGEQVLTHKNRYRPVVARTPRQADELCDLYAQGLPSNLPSLTATPNHELWSVTREDFLRKQALKEMEFSWVPISSLRAGDYIAEPFSLEEDAAALGDEKWNCPAVAFLMGLYAAEGCISRRYDRDDDRAASVIYVVSGEETTVIDRARRHAESLGHGLQDYKSKSGTSYRLQLCFAEFARLCKQHIGTPATDKKLSADLLRMPRGWQCVFLAAYAAGDGCVRQSGKEGGTQRMVSASALLLRGMRLMLARQGLVGSISGRHNTKASWYNGNPIYELSVSGGQLRGRGTPKSYLHPDGFILSAVKKVKQYSWEGEVYDLTVEEDSSFTASGVTVHNSNVNGDHFPEASLIHMPDNWTGVPVIDKVVSKNWGYGFPTFYNAHPYAHHRNKDASRAFGEVELATWNPAMKRVELVVRVDHDKCMKFGGAGVWDKLRIGQYPDVSMGCVPAGTRVMLADGSYKNMECMQEADLVLTHRGVPGRVDELLRYHYKGTLYKFKVYGFQRELCLTENHPLWLVRSQQLQCHPVSTSEQKWNKELVPRQRHCTPFVKENSKGCSTCSVVPNYSFEWVRADESEVGDYAAFAVPEEVDTTVSSVEEARFLGYYLAEGHVGNYNNRPLEQITFSLGYGEKELAEEIEGLGRQLGASVAWHSEDPERGGRYVSVVSRRLAERCLHFCGSGAKTKQLSRAVLYMDPGLQLHFLGAYLNGDGGAYKGSAYFSTASEQLAHQLFVVLSRCKMIASINEIKHRPSEKSVVRTDTVEFQVWVGTDFSYLLGPYTRKSVRASKKVRGQRFFYRHEGTQYILAPIEEIVEEDYNDDVFNISVAGDDSYQAERIAVHNTKVPYDTCSICLDWELYRKAEAQSTNRDNPGKSILEFHRKKKTQDGVGIRGLSVTRKDYCTHAKDHMNRILPDGRKVWVYNDYPRFFDISFVFIGADRTAKVMLFVFRNGQRYSSKPSAEVAEEAGVSEKKDDEKVASIEDELLKAAFGKLAVPKKAEIDKDIVPSQFAGKAVPILTKCEPDIPNETLDGLASLPLKDVLSTLTGLGVVLKPREFQRITLIQLGRGDLADALDNRGEVMPRTDEVKGIDLDKGSFRTALAKLLQPLMELRSALGPVVEKRMVLSSDKPVEKEASAPSHHGELLATISATYNGYRHGVMELVAHSQDLLASGHSGSEFQKLANAEPESIFTPLSVAYLQNAYMDAFGVPRQGVVKLSTSCRGEGFPLEEHVAK